jgi:hypothetical protein
MTNARLINRLVASRLNSLREKYPLRRSLTSAAKAETENAPEIAAVNRSTPARQNQACWGPRRCATQSQVLRRFFPQAVKPSPSQNPAGVSAEFIENIRLDEPMKVA